MGTPDWVRNYLPGCFACFSTETRRYLERVILLLHIGSEIISRIVLLVFLQKRGDILKESFLLQIGSEIISRVVFLVFLQKRWDILKESFFFSRLGQKLFPGLFFLFFY